MRSIKPVARFPWQSFKREDSREGFVDDFEGDVEDFAGFFLAGAATGGAPFAAEAEFGVLVAQRIAGVDGQGAFRECLEVILGQRRCLGLKANKSHRRVKGEANLIKVSSPDSSMRLFTKPPILDVAFP